jgi:transcriptional regulator with XRE-family HTH domain
MDEPSPIDVHVGSRVRLRRSLLGMSQEKLGAALGLTFQQVQKYERGTNRISASRLWDLSLILDVPVSFFFDAMPSGGSIGAKAGSGEQGQASFEPSPVADRMTTQLIQAYQRISDPDVRRRILELVRALAEQKP